MQSPENEQNVVTQVALLKQSVESMGSDIAEMKQDFKEFRNFYYTKEQAANMRSEFLTMHNTLAKDFENWVSLWKKIIVGVLVIVCAAIILYVLHIPIAP